MAYQVQKKPYRVPTGDGKLIEEHFGRAASGHEYISIAHMVAPPGWGEPCQTPEFDEWTLVSSGKKMIEVDGDQVVLEAGESILISKGSSVRYSNPFDVNCEYWSVCLPAFSLETARRKAEQEEEEDV